MPGRGVSQPSAGPAHGKDEGPHLPQATETSLDHGRQGPRHRATVHLYYRQCNHFFPCLQFLRPLWGEHLQPSSRPDKLGIMAAGLNERPGCGHTHENIAVHAISSSRPRLQDASTQCLHVFSCMHFHGRVIFPSNNQNWIDQASLWVCPA